jgi:preprotein translocase subunit SecA
MEEITSLHKSGAKDDENLEAVRAFLVERIKTAYDVKASMEEEESLINLERFVIIRAIDRHWQDHLTEMEDLRKSVGLRSYGQKDPLSEYKSEAYRYFEELMANVREEICTAVFRSASNLEVFQRTIASLGKNIKQQGPVEGGGTLIDLMQASAREQARQEGKNIELPQPQEAPKPVPVQREEPKVGRNDPCPCGSGKKYKKCCGA